MNTDNLNTYVDVVLPLALHQLYTYRVPPEMAGKPGKGKRVIVSFGKSKIYTALIYNIHNRKPEGYNPKDLTEVIDSVPIVTESQFKLWEWISEYYLCTLGEIMIAAIPSVLKLQSETAVSLQTGFDFSESLFTEEELLIINYLKEHPSMTILDASKITGSKNGVKLIGSLVDKNFLVVHEEMKSAFKPKEVEFVRMSAKTDDESFMQDLFSQLEKRAPKQLDLLMAFMHMKSEREKAYISKKKLLSSADASSQALLQLVKKGVFEIFSESGSLAVEPAADTGRTVDLNDEQKNAYERIKENFKERRITLLHGVTSSGKTEVYIRLITDIISQGKQVLYLLPEIALTTQIISRLKSHFGDRLLVFHSRFSNRERGEVYMKLVNEKTVDGFRYPIIIGARSSVFLPLINPGLIIVDEEHDGSYKQHDPAPRYNARDTAVVCGSIFNCNVILGSATPGMESYYNAQTGKYDLVKINGRYGGLKMPEIKIVDIKDAYKKKLMKSYFSQELLNGIKLALDAKEQVILFQNRRGFAPVLECRNCGWIPHCINCDVSLTYHKRSNQLKCHYCGYTTFPPVKCNACGDHDVRMKGVGTERIEDEISIYFPESRIQRLDLDTSSSKSAFHRIISEFENGEIDILVGTQMVTKGLDFDNVSLVGVLNADSLINFPDFRSVERSYQLMAQVAGRAGRKFKRGKVLIQTYQTNHPLLAFLIKNDFEGFYNYELGERTKYNYPPLCRLIRIKLRNRDEKLLEELSKDFTVELKKIFGSRVMGPVSPPVARVRNFYIRNVLLKIEKTLSNKKVKEMLLKANDRFLSFPENRSLIIQIDVDPV